jgi:hypothetical protein
MTVFGESPNPEKEASLGKPLPFPPAGQARRILHLPLFLFTTRYSKNARYVSFTAEWEVASSEEVISLYRQAAEIKGVIAL